jgi:hypothetical protein
MLRPSLSNVLAAAAILAGAACGSDTTAPALPTVFTAALLGPNERPTPNTSTATGSATVTINESAQSITYTVTVNNLTTVVAAHIHTGRSDAAGPVVVNLLPTAPAAGPFSGTLTSGTATMTNIATGVPVTFNSLVSLIRNGDAYVNVHTSAFPGGEVRGQLIAQ